MMRKNSKLSSTITFILFFLSLSTLAKTNLSPLPSTKMNDYNTRSETTRYGQDEPELYIDEMNKHIGIANSNEIGSSTPVAEASVPVIDFASFIIADNDQHNIYTDNDENSNNILQKQQEECVSQVLHACMHVGFFKIKNHEVSDDIIENFRRSSREFFNEPMDVKLKARDGEHHARGYLTNENQAAAAGRDGPPDSRERYAISEDCQHYKTLWPPQGNPKFKSFGEAYYKEMRRIEKVLNVIISRALLKVTKRTDLVDDNWLDGALGNFNGLLFSNNYAYSDNNNGKGLAAHSDFGTLTILLPFSSGLEVIQANEWRPVTYDESEDHQFVINVGNILERWSNGIFKFSIHQLTPPETINRQDNQRHISQRESPYQILTFW
jgi:isopenicillin N synthase-like dioxygenase